MAKKVVVDKNVTEVRKALKGKHIIGAQAGLKNLKLGKIEKVFLASNCKEEVKGGVEKLAKLSGARVVVIKQPNDELGTICKKPFSISMLSVIKTKK